MFSLRTENITMFGYIMENVYAINLDDVNSKNLDVLKLLMTMHSYCIEDWVMPACKLLIS